MKSVLRANVPAGVDDKALVELAAKINAQAQALTVRRVEAERLPHCFSASPTIPPPQLYEVNGRYQQAQVECDLEEFEIRRLLARFLKELRPHLQAAVQAARDGLVRALAGQRKRMNAGGTLALSDPEPARASAIGQILFNAADVRAAKARIDQTQTAVQSNRELVAANELAGQALAGTITQRRGGVVYWGRCSTEWYERDARIKAQMVARTEERQVEKTASVFDAEDGDDLPALVEDARRTKRITTLDTSPTRTRGR